MGDRGFRFGDWQIDPDSNTLSNGTAQAQLEPRAMDVLRYLCRHPGAVIPTEEILEACWGSSEMGDNPIHKAITQLRRALGDSASEPRYIETVRKRGYRAIAAVIANEAAEEGSWLQGSPFRGLEAFQENHAAIFFGRMQACSQLRELVTRQVESGSAMALVLGPSGSGKTSLVRAGLLPQLMEAQAGPASPIALACTLYMDCADLAEGNLFQALAAVLIDTEVDGKLLFSGESADTLGKKLEGNESSEVIGRLQQIFGRIRIALFVDRVEAIFRVCDVSKSRNDFIALLEAISRSGSVLVMLACRNDFYPAVIAMSTLMELKARGGHFDLSSPDGADIAQIVRMPARAAQLRFEQDTVSGANLDDVLCDAARGSPDTLPLLQYCLNELYRQRSDDGLLRFDIFRQLGGIEGSVAARAEQVVAALAPGQRAALPHVLSLLVDIAKDQAVTARRVAWSALENLESQELVRALVEARLFVSELAGGEPSFGVAHEALLRRWPRVAEWIEKHRHALQIRTRVSQDAARWLSAGRPRDLLIPAGSQVSQARTLLDMNGFTLSVQEKEYVQSSLKREKLTERLKIAVMSLVITLAILIGILGAFARGAQKDAEQHRTEAEGLMGYMLGDLAEKLRTLGRLELLDGISNKALLYLSASKNPDATQAALAQRARALQVIAEVNIARANPEQATKALLAARAILQQQLRASEKNKDLLKDLGANAFWLGQMRFNSGEWELAERYFSDYRDFSDTLVALDPENIDGWIEQSYAYSSIGSAALNRGDLAKAAHEFSASIELKRKALAKQADNKILIAGLANSLSGLAEIKSKQGQLGEAMKLHEQEELLLRPLHSTSATDATWAHRLANALFHQGELKLALGQQVSAQESFLTAESLLKSIVKYDPSNRSWQIVLYTVQSRLYESSIDNTNQAELLSKKIALFENLSDLSALEPDRGELSRLLATARLSMASTYSKVGKITEAAEQFTASIDLFEKLYKSNSADPQLVSQFADALISNSEFRKVHEPIGSFASYCGRAKHILLSASNRTSDYRLLVQEVRAHACMGDYSGVAALKKILESMAYQDPRYFHYLSPHQPKKGNL